MESNPQRKLNSSMPNLKVGTLRAAPQRAPSGGDLARSAPKNVAIAAPIPGQHRQTPDSVYTGPGQSALEDEPNLPIKSHAKPIPVHAGMTPAQRAKVNGYANDPKVIIADAEAFGRKA